MSASGPAASARLSRIAAAFVIGRRDYTATVLSKTFFFFLLGPLFPILLGILFGGIGARVAGEGEQKALAVVAGAADYQRLARTRAELSGLPGIGALPQLKAAPPGTDPALLLSKRESDTVAVLVDPFGHPELVGSISEKDAITGQVRLLLVQARQSSAPIPDVTISRLQQTASATQSAREITARAGQALLFLLTLLLAGMLLSQLIEEKSNKVIEVLAAAVPVDSIFLGKLFAMLCVSLTGILVWASAAVATLALIASPAALAALPAPAVGWPLFALLAALYFAMSYLLIGAAFLGIGAQASTVREVQTLSMPITMAQVGLFALANLAVSDAHGPGGVAAALFPFSSPFTMIARAALDDAVLPHLAALAWQGLWISLILKVASAWFRRSVLDSGSREPRRWFRRAKA